MYFQKQSKHDNEEQSNIDHDVDDDDNIDDNNSIYMIFFK